MKHLVSIDHINLSVKNLAEAAEWYKKLFGFEVVEQGIYDGSIFAILRSADSMLCLYQEEGLNDPKAWLVDRGLYRIYHFGLRISDKKVWEELLHKHNIKTYNDSPITYPYSQSWYIQDPTGHEIEVSYWINNEIHF